MANLSTESVIARTSEALATTVDDELVIVHFESNAYYGLDAIGRRIWELLEQPQMVSELCAQLRTEYSVSQARCEADVLGFLNELLDDRVLRRASVADSVR